MKTVLSKIFLVFTFLFFSFIEKGSAQTTILYYDFENNSDTSKGENTCEINQTQSAAATITKTGGITTTVYFNGNPSTGKAISFRDWRKNGPHDTGIYATEYLEFNLDSRRFSSFTLSADIRASNSLLRSIGLLYSSDSGKNFYKVSSYSLSSIFKKYSWDLSSISSVNNTKNIRFRLYAWGDTSLSVQTNFRMDNLKIVADVGTPLPVTLISFEGKGSLLSWKTASEINNDYFEIEKAEQNSISDSLKFHSIGIVYGNGTTNEIHEYKFEDTSLSNFSSEILYYRLKQVDFNGNYEYSQILKIYRKDFKKEISQKFEIQYGVFFIEVEDKNGKVVKRINYKNK